jgi:hypothetical protein
MTNRLLTIADRTRTPAPNRVHGLTLVSDEVRQKYEILVDL